MRPLLVVSVFILAVNTFGCSSSKTLTSEQTWDLIATDPGFLHEKAGTIGVTDEALAEGEKEGYWESKPPNTHFLTVKGNEYFWNIVGYPDDKNEVWCVVAPRTNLTKRVTKVTRIMGKEGDSSRQVEFEWEADLESLPAELKLLFEHQHPQKEQKTLTRYDDGWRVER